MGYTRLDSPMLDAKTTLPSYLVQGYSEYGGAYVSVDYATSLQKEDVSEQHELGNSSHTDLDLTLGYRIAKSWKLFAGFRDSDTDINFADRRDMSDIQEESYGKDGYFLGGSYSLELGKPGVITLNMGYTNLDTSNLFRSASACDLAEGECGGESSVEEFSDLEGKQVGSAEGWSYGFIWLIPLTTNVAFNTSFKLSEYTEKIDYEGESFSADQKTSFFNVGVQYSF